MMQTFFAPQLYIKAGVRDISFYFLAFGAEELRRWSNGDGSIHVAELSIDGAVFHLHEASPEKGLVDPSANGSTTTLIGLFVEDVDKTVANALAAGAELISEAQSFDYGYRQGQIRDPFGHQWLIEMRI